MSIQEIANRLVELCRTGQYDEAYKELFADNAVSIEPESAPNPRVEGLDNLFKKSAGFAAMVEEWHDSSISDPIVATDYFTISMMIDITMKGVGRSKTDEICVYEVKNGKIVREQFFYNR